MIGRTHDADGSYETLKLPETETRNAVLGNLFICEGKPGPVLKVHCKGRTGKTPWTNYLYKHQSKLSSSKIIYL